MAEGEVEADKSAFELWGDDSSHLDMGARRT